MRALARRVLSDDDVRVAAAVAAALNATTTTPTLSVEEVVAAVELWSRSLFKGDDDDDDRAAITRSLLEWCRRRAETVATDGDENGEDDDGLGWLVEILTGRGRVEGSGRRVAGGGTT